LKPASGNVEWLLLELTLFCKCIWL